MFELVQKFQEWCAQKVALHFLPHRPQFRQGEVWWCKIGMNIGDEIYGKGSHFQRPVLILKKYTKNIFLAIPFSTVEHKGTWYVETELGGMRRWAILNQARTMDALRLVDPVGEFDAAMLARIRAKFFKLIAS